MTVELLNGAREIAAFCEGKTVVGVAEPLDNHTRFRFADDSALLVVYYPGRVYSEHSEDEAYVAYYGEPAAS